MNFITANNFKQASSDMKSISIRQWQDEITIRFEFTFDSIYRDFENVLTNHSPLFGNQIIYFKTKKDAALKIAELSA